MPDPRRRRLAALGMAVCLTLVGCGAADDTTAPGQASAEPDTASEATANEAAANETPTTAVPTTAVPTTAVPTTAVPTTDFPLTGGPADALLTGEVTTITGETLDLASLRGTDVVLWFWAPW